MEGATHNFMGKSYSEMTATSAGIAAGGAFSNATVTALDHGVKSFTLVVEPVVGKDGWIIKLIPDGSLLATPLMFGIYYSAHNKNYNFYAMDAHGTFALYIGNAAFGLSLGQIERAINKGFEILTGRSSPVFGSAATSLISGVAIGLLATKAKVDIEGKKFNVFSVLSTALVVGHAVAYSGKTIRLGVKSMLVDQNISEETATRLGGAAAGTVFTSSVVILTATGSKIPASLKNYHGKVIGDMTKNIGLMLSVDLMRPGIELARDSVNAAWDSVENMLHMPDIIKRLSHTARDPIMIFISHQILVKTLMNAKGGVLHDRIYDLIIGYILGGFIGLFDSPHKIITERTWGEHAMVWSLAALTTFLIHSAARDKTKVD